MKRNHFWVVESQDSQDPEKWNPTCDGHCIQVEARGLLAKREQFYPGHKFRLVKYVSESGEG